MFFLIVLRTENKRNHLRYISIGRTPVGTYDKNSKSMLKFHTDILCETHSITNDYHK